MRKIAVIPARSGSKGIKDKNIRELDGKPLLFYSVNAAQKSGIFDVIHVSTDSERYAQLAKSYGADVPFLRKRSLASDTVTMWETIKHVLERYAGQGDVFDTVTVLQPTSPLRDEKDIIGAWEYFQRKQANMVSSVCVTEHSPLWSNVLPEDMSMEHFEDERLVYLPRQSLPTYYRENGAIYIVKTKHLYEAVNIYKDCCYAYIMDQEHSVDIDSEVDFVIAQALLQNLN